MDADESMKLFRVTFYLSNDLLHEVQSGKSLRFKRWEFQKNKMINFPSRDHWIAWDFFGPLNGQEEENRRCKSMLGTILPPPDIVCYILRVRLIMHFKIFEGNSPIIG